MTSPRSTARVIAALANVPAGRVVTLDVLARHLGGNRPGLVGLVATLRDDPSPDVPWHRIVAEGGAIGRHRWRDIQIARLREEGVSVSPAGIVEGLAERRVPDLSKPAAPPPPPAAPGTPSRSRGMKSHPG